ncbi:DUF5979 domain-containing protein [Actinomyces wuliandei]|uniref:DUF5979 domain-containing protein n=1 Tax=Actinomyces wuliandei TaxID=2057743 RepID=UPI001119C6AA|nr:DUF5979 domain-containing protein [Actinomyces wuliandei]
MRISSLRVSPSQHAATPRAVARGVAACLLALALLLTMLTALTAPARAAQNLDIDVTVTSLDKSDANGNVQSGFLRVGDVAKLAFTWDAGDTDVSSGDYFSIDLGNAFRNREYPRTNPMTVTVGGQQVTIGSCQLQEHTITCTFNDEVETVKEQGGSLLRGSGEALLIAAQVVEAETVDMDLNGTTTAVDLPGTGGILPQAQPTYRPAAFSKVATPLAATSTTVPWSITMGAAHLESVLPGFVADGTTESTVVLTEEAGPGQAFVTNLNSWVFRRASSAESATSLNLVNAAGRVYNSPGEDFTYTVEFNDDATVATMTITGIFQPDTNYSLSAPASINSGTAVEGVIYRNSVTLEGADVTANAERYYTDSFKIAVELANGFGGFEITKYLDGQALDEIAAGTTFDVDVAYTLPQAASEYTGWTPPGTLADDGLTGTTTLTVTMGKVTVYPGSFPAGTQITLTEDPATASPDASAYQWGDPVFRIGNRVTDTFTVGNRTSTALGLTNTADYKPGTLAVAKTVTGLESAAPRTYSYSYTCGGLTGTISNVPGDGTPVEADATIPAGTECTVTEDVDAAAMDGYDLAAPDPVTVTVLPSEEAVTEAAFTNAYTRHTGTFSVAKQVGPEDVPFLTDTFDIGYTCTTPEGEEVSGTLQVTGGGSAVGGPTLPVGTTCSVSEPEETTQRDGYNVSTLITVDGTEGSQLTIAKDTTSEVSVVNAYTALTGGFQISKEVTGDGAGLADSQTYVFTYTCTGGNGTTTTDTVELVSGATTAVTDVPVGSCTVSEADASVDGADLTTTWSMDGEEVDGEVTFDVADGATAVVQATNDYTVHRGGFSVAKEVTGAEEADLSDKEFGVTYTCTDGSTGMLAIGADGQSVSGPQVPVGAECTVSEDTASASLAGYTLTAPEDQTVTVEARDQETALTLTNAYTRQTGSFAVSKAVDGDGAARAPQSFSFTYTCTGTDGSATTGTVETVDAGSAVVSDVPVGRCTVSEEDASVEGTDLLTQVVVGGEPVAAEETSFAVTDGGMVAVVATNTYTLHRGSFSVTKVVEGLEEDAEGTEGPGDPDAQAAPRDYLVTYTCTLPEDAADAEGGADEGVVSDEVTVPAGMTVTSPALPLGTECTLSEDADSAQVDGYTLEVPEDQAVTITTQDAVEELTVTNTYTRDVEPTPEPSESPAPQPSGEPSTEPSTVATSGSATAPSESSEVPASASPSPGGSSVAGSLARTGAALLLPAVAALAAIGGGSLLLRRRRQ